MAFFDRTDNSSNFVISFSTQPREDFGIFARGYFYAASELAGYLLGKGRFSDYEAYPVMFLYRHAFELHLKNIIYRSALLSAFRNLHNIDTKLYKTHRLDTLSKIATEILCKLFSNDQDIDRVSRQVKEISSEFSKYDPESYSYRYPIDNDGNYSTKPHQVASLKAVHQTMNELLEDLETLDFGLSVETSQARELYEILSAWVSSTEDFSP